MSQTVEGKPKWWHLIYLILILVLILGLLFFLLNNYKHILIDKLAFANTTSLSLLLIFTLPILLFMVPLSVKRLLNPSYENSERVIKTLNVSFILCGIGLFTPLFVGPLTSQYMKSNGYEKCKHPSATTFTSTLNQYWAKPEIGCGVWSLDSKERQALKRGL